MTTARTRKTTAPAKKAAKKTAKKTAKKPAAKRTAIKTAKKTADVPGEDSSADADEASQETQPSTPRRASAPRAESKPTKSAFEVARRAASELAQLTGKAPEAITGIERTDKSWRVTVDVLELRRVPATTDVLARYEIETDDNGSLMGYRRAGRFTRGSTQED